MALDHPVYLDLPFRGGRNNVQGSDRFNALVSLVEPKGADLHSLLKKGAEARSIAAEGTVQSYAIDQCSSIKAIIEFARGLRSGSAAAS